MIKILLDTNIFIYLEDNAVTDDKVLELTKRLFDSNDYKIVIHPKTKQEIEKIKDIKKKEIFKSKIAVYKEINSPPIPNNTFHNTVGCNNKHDEIDNNLLYAVKQNCVEYLITNDKQLKNKSKKINIEDRVLTIDEALNKFIIEKEETISVPVFVKEKYLYQLQVEDPFFDSLRKDYYNFDKWFIKKQKEEAKAYVTYNNDKLSSFLMLKIEDKEESYKDFDKPFSPAKRLKVSTMKVADTGKRIGEVFIKMIVKEAIENNVEEIYVTVFKKQEHLIDMLNEYGFKYYGDKTTLNKDGIIEKENIYVKKISMPEEYYPFIRINNKQIFLIPIKEEYHNLLFQESEKNIQISLDDIIGKNTAGNSLKKAYICNSNIKKIKPGSIIIFYSTRTKKAITSLGVVDAVFTDFNNFEEMYNLVKRRTAYSEDELIKQYKSNNLVIMFKHYYSLENYVGYNFLLENKIVKGSIQRITEIKEEDLIKILNEGNFDKNKYLI